MARSRLVGDIGIAVERIDVGMGDRLLSLVDLHVTNQPTPCRRGRRSSGGLHPDPPRSHAVPPRRRSDAESLDAMLMRHGLPGRQPDMHLETPTRILHVLDVPEYREYALPRTSTGTGMQQEFLIDNAVLPRRVYVLLYYPNSYLILDTAAVQYTYTTVR